MNKYPTDTLYKTLDTLRLHHTGQKHNPAEAKKRLTVITTGKRNPRNHFKKSIITLSLNIHFNALQ